MRPMNSGPIQAFHYLTAEKTKIYRAIMSVFVQSKANFSLSLRPQEIFQALIGLTEEVSEVEAALRQLCSWGNLEAHPDTSEVATIEDFYRPRSLYQITQEGEAAEQAVQTYFAAVEQEGELQVAALTDIQSLLTSLLQEAKFNPDANKIHLTLTSLQSRFDELTLRAQGFMRGLHRSLEMPIDDLSLFSAYKEMLISYLERFIRELVLLTPSITTLILDIEALYLSGILELAAKRGLADALAPTDEDFEWELDQWRRSWQGLRSWFIAKPGSLSQSEILRNRARRAIPSLLTLVQRINDRRVNRSDRSADLRVLARWFAETETERKAHRLWQAAFSLSPSRHLSIDQATLNERESEPVSAQTSWLDAPPIQIAPRLKKSGSYQRKGAASTIIDRTHGKELLALSLAQETDQILEAHRRLATNGKIKLSDIGTLSPQEFELFLDLLGNALSQKRSPGEILTAQSTDGSIRIRLEPIENSKIVILQTETGTFRGPDHFLEITSDWVSPETSQTNLRLNSQSPNLQTKEQEWPKNSPI